MHLEKRGTIYYLHYQRPDGSRAAKSTGAKTKADALKFLNGFVIERQDSTPKEITLERYYWEFMKPMGATHRAKTVRDYTSTFKFFVSYFGKDRELANLTRQDLLLYFNNRLRTSSIYQARKDYINLKHIFNEAILQGYLKENPVKTIPAFKLPEVQPTYFTKEEFRILLGIIDSPIIKDITILAVNTGMRQGELLALRASQINQDGRYIILDNNIHLTKSGRVRTIPINAQAMQVIQRNQATGDELLFPDITPDYLTRLFKQYVLKSGVNPKLHFHSLRHTFASWLVQADIPIQQVSQLLGHADLKTTQIYAHLSVENLRKSVQSLDMIACKQ